jgi:hypothetical protein
MGRVLPANIMVEAIPARVAAFMAFGHVDDGDDRGWRAEGDRRGSVGRTLPGADG